MLARSMVHIDMQELTKSGSTVSERSFDRPSSNYIHDVSSGGLKHDLQQIRFTD